MYREARSAKSRQQRRSRRNHGRFVAILKLTNQVQGVPQSATVSRPELVQAFFGPGLADFVGYSAKMCQASHERPARMPGTRSRVFRHLT
jgi:hypothetical protein